jgi:hypothetical protein
MVEDDSLIIIHYSRDVLMPAGKDKLPYSNIIAKKVREGIRSGVSVKDILVVYPEVSELTFKYSYLL